MSAVEELIAFVRQQLDAKEQEAQAFLARTGTSLLAQRLYREQLAEVEAKRRVLDEFGWEAGETRAITYLAQPYAGWPGWREEWAV